MPYVYLDAGSTHPMPLGARAALVKGGDLEGDVLTDVLYDGERLEVFRDARIRTTSTHGSGCALASAIAAHLARGDASAESPGDALVAAVAAARAWVRSAWSRIWCLSCPDIVLPASAGRSRSVRSVRLRWATRRCCRSAGCTAA